MDTYRLKLVRSNGYCGVSKVNEDGTLRNKYNLREMEPGGEITPVFNDRFTSKKSEKVKSRKR
jgi:hypothetical protein